MEDVTSKDVSSSEKNEIDILKESMDFAGLSKINIVELIEDNISFDAEEAFFSRCSEQSCPFGQRQYEKSFATCLTFHATEAFEQEEEQIKVFFTSKQ